MLFVPSPDSKGNVSYCHQLPSVVHCLLCFPKLSYLSSTPTPLYHLRPNLARFVLVFVLFKNYVHQLSNMATVTKNRNNILSISPMKPLGQFYMHLNWSKVIWKKLNSNFSKYCARLIIILEKDLVTISFWNKENNSYDRTIEFKNIWNHLW